MTSPLAPAVKIQNRNISRHLNLVRDAAPSAGNPQHDEKLGQNLPQYPFEENETGCSLKGMVACFKPL
jgi:hypothetical protein